MGQECRAPHKRGKELPCLARQTYHHDQRRQTPREQPRARHVVAACLWCKRSALLFILSNPRLALPLLTHPQRREPPKRHILRVCCPRFTQVNTACSVMLGLTLLPRVPSPIYIISYRERAHPEVIYHHLLSDARAVPKINMYKRTG